MHLIAKSACRTALVSVQLRKAIAEHRTVLGPARLHNSG